MIVEKKKKKISFHRMIYTLDDLDNTLKTKIMHSSLNIRAFPTYYYFH
jgi:hypothetical protein